MRQVLPVGAAVVTLVLAAGGAATGAPPALPGQVNACSTDPGGLSKLDSFQGALRKLHVDLYDADFAAENDVQGHLGLADEYAKPNTARMIQEANEALGSLPGYRSKLDAVALDFDAMRRSSDFTDRRGVVSLIEPAMAQINAGISKHHQAGDHWEAAANAFLAYSYGAAEASMEAGALTFADGVMSIQAGEARISSAIATFGELSSCDDVSDVTAALSANQVSRRAGGGGTQRRGGDDLSIVAPKRLKLKKRGTTKLPMTLKVSKPGMIEVWLNRGTQLLVNIHVGVLREGRVRPAAQRAAHDLEARSQTEAQLLLRRGRPDQDGQPDHEGLPLVALAPAFLVAADGEPRARPFGTASRSGRARLLINKGGGTFGDETASRLPQTDNNGAWSSFIRQRDLNRDRRVDFGLQVIGATGSAPLFILDPQGAFKPGPPVNLGSQIWSFIDAEGDGSNDILTANSTAVSLFRERLVPDTTAPTLTRLKLSPSVFRAARSGASIAAANLGSKLSYAASEPATTTFKVENALPGVRRGRSCVRPPRRAPSGKRCTRFLAVRGTFAHRDSAGPNQMRFTGRVRRRR